MLQILSVVVCLGTAAINAAVVMSGHGSWFTMAMTMVLCFIAGGNAKILLERWLEMG